MDRRDPDGCSVRVALGRATERAVTSLHRSLRDHGAVLLVSCYELGHQPLGLAWPRAFLERAGFAPDTIDLAVEPLDEAKVRRARLVAIAGPQHTAPPARGAPPAPLSPHKPP